MPEDQQVNTGSFVPTTNIWDVQRLQEVDVKSEEFKELLVRLYQNINNICLALNIKDVGYYSTTEFLNGQLFFPVQTVTDLTEQSQTYRQVFRTVVDFGALPNAGTKSVAHNIEIVPGTPTTFSFTRIYGASSKLATQDSFIPLPFSSPTLNQNIKLEVDNTNVIVTTAIDYSLYTTTYCVLEYLKQL
jgi:hypothetical protein